MGARPSTFVFSQPGPLRLLGTPELLTMQPPTWLVDGVLPTGALCGLYGPPASTKSFITIDLALCVATGTPWHGRAVRRGFVLYVAAEGGPGISKRVRAWLSYHHISPTEPGIGWLIEAVMMHTDSADLTTIRKRLDTDVNRMPDLIVIDTLARCFAGDENQQEDMGRFVAGIDELRHEYDATVIAVHHTRLDGERERGNTAFRGAADTMISVKRGQGHIEVACDKQKDAEHFDPIGFRLKVLEDEDSCVMLCTDNQKADKMEQILQYLEKGPLSYSEWLRLTGVPPATFKRYIVSLRKKGKIVNENGVWSIH